MTHRSLRGKSLIGLFAVALLLFGLLESVPAGGASRLRLPIFEDQFQLEANLPDLMIRGVRYEPAVVRRGDNVSFTAEIINTGALVTMQPLLIRVTDSLGSEEKTVYRPFFFVDDVFEVKFSRRLELHEQIYFFKVDPTNLIPEGNELNNDAVVFLRAAP